MISVKELFENTQEYKSAGTSLNQVSAGIKHAVKHGLIKPNTTNADIGGGKYDAGKEHVEDNISGAKMHVYDPYNRSETHNKAVESQTTGQSHYVGCHNVLNVIKDESDRANVIKKVKDTLHPHGTAHFTTYEGDRSSEGRATQKDQSWQNHRPTKSYVPEIEKVFGDTHKVVRKGANIIVSKK